MKRKASDEGGSKPAVKKSHHQLTGLSIQPKEAGIGPESESPCVPSIADDDEDDDEDDDDEDDTNSNSPLPTPTTALSTVASTTNSRRGRKFPSDLKTIRCTHPGCPKTFNRPARLTAHLRSHTNDRAFKCPYEDCDKDYLEEKHLAQHIKGTHTQERKYVCHVEGCDKSFVTATRLRRHAAVHEGHERFKCRGYEGCDASFRKHQTLTRHIRVVHLGASGFICEGPKGCGEGFDTAGALRRHVEREHGEKKFWCDECAKGGGGREIGFTTLLLLQSHMRREHVNCMFCDVKCGTQGDLERHIDTYHSGSTIQDRKTVECTWPGCTKKFTRVSNLNTHVRTAHEGVRFVCGKVDTFETEDISEWNWMEEGCGQGFVSRMKLEEHVRFIHLGRKRPPRLHTIQSTAPGEEDEMTAAPLLRNIPCTILGCDVKFIRHADLTKHLERDHGPQPEAPLELPPETESVGDTEYAIDPQLQLPVYSAGQDDQGFWIPPEVPQNDQQHMFGAAWPDDDLRHLIDFDGAQ